MTALTEEIIAIEWDMFDKVQNVGGRASCQDDWTTFHIMRSSQLEAWTQELRECYYDDLQTAKRTGRNPLSEKYGYMMERTSPAEFAKIAPMLPPRQPQKDILINRICAAHVVWLEEMTEKYPHVAHRGRAIRREQDSPTTTSFETYLWGELATYSLRTITKYAAYVQQLQREGKNLNEMVLQNTVAQYGYTSLEDAESKLSR
ncbi:MAG: DUF4125 family protein [Butyricicoccus sp.]